MDPQNTINATPEDITFYHADGKTEHYKKSSEYTGRFVETPRAASVHIPSFFQNRYPYSINPAFTGVTGLPFPLDPSNILIVTPFIGEYLARSENSYLWSGMVIGMDMNPAQLVKEDGRIVGTRKWIIYKGISPMYN